MMSGRGTVSLRNQRSPNMPCPRRATRRQMDRQNLPAAAPWRQILACFRRRLAGKIACFSQRLGAAPVLHRRLRGRASALQRDACRSISCRFPSTVRTPKIPSPLQSLLQQDISGVEQRAVRSDRVAVGGAGPRPRQRHRRNGTVQRVSPRQAARSTSRQFLAAIRSADPAGAARHCRPTVPTRNPWPRSLAAVRGPDDAQFVATQAQPGRPGHHHHHHHAGSANDGSTAAPTTATLGRRFDFAGEARPVAPTWRTTICSSA